MQVLPAVSFGFVPAWCQEGTPECAVPFRICFPWAKKLALKAISPISSWVVQVGVKRSVLHITSELRFR